MPKIDILRFLRNFWRENSNKTFLGDFNTLCLYCKGVCKKVFWNKSSKTRKEKNCFVNPFGIFEVIENGKLSKKKHLSKKIFNFSQNWMSWLEVEQTFFSPQISPRGKTCCHCQSYFWMVFHRFWKSWKFSLIYYHQQSWQKLS